MKSRNTLLIILAILILVLLVLSWAIFRSLGSEEVLQSSSYVEMFGTTSMGENNLNDEFKRNIRLDIVEVNRDRNGTSTARTNVIMPDLIRTYREINENYDVNNMSTRELDEKLIVYLRNNLTTIQREFEVINQGGNWVISDNSNFDALLEEQADALMMEIFRSMIFEPFSGDEIIRVPEPNTQSPPNRR